MELVVVGCGDAFGSGGRSHACYLLRGESGTVLLDCGPGAGPALRRQGVSPAEIDAVLLSHFHGDHFGGVPFLFLEARHAGGRRRPLVVAGPTGVEDRVERLGAALYASGSASARPDLGRYLELAPGITGRAGPAAVHPFAAQHQEGEPCLGLDVRMDGRRVVYSGDTRPFPGLLEAARGADLLIWECSWGTGETGSGHTRLEEVLAARSSLGCQRLLLVHLGPAVLAARDEHDLPWAADGMRIPL